MANPTAPEYADEESPNTPALVRGIRPHKPCLKDPGYLPRGINTPPSPPINRNISLKLFLGVFFTYPLTDGQDPTLHSLVPD